MRDKITKRAVDALRPGSDGAEAMLWDTEVKGFGCRVQRGGSKSYIVHYRVGTGRGAPLRKLTIGKHGAPWTPETARKEARRLRRWSCHPQVPEALRIGVLLCYSARMAPWSGLQSS